MILNKLLLTSRPLVEFTSEEFFDLTRSYYEAPAVKSEISSRINAHGTLVISTKRKPKWITRTEIDRIAATLARPVSDIWNYCKDKGYSIVEMPKDGRALEKTIILTDQV